MQRKPNSLIPSLVHNASSFSERADIDTGLAHELKRYVDKFEDGFPAALRDAMEFCKDHSLFLREDLTEDLLQLVLKLRCQAELQETSPRQRKPKGNPTRRRKGRPADPQVHIERYNRVEAFLEAQTDPNETSVTAAARAVGGGQWDAFRKSYWKVVQGNLYDGYYEPDYVDCTGEP